MWHGWRMLNRTMASIRSTTGVAQITEKRGRKQRSSQETRAPTGPVPVRAMILPATTATGWWPKERMCISSSHAWPTMGCTPSPIIIPLTTGRRSNRTNSGNRWQEKAISFQAVRMWRSTERMWCWPSTSTAPCLTSGLPPTGEPLSRNASSMRRSKLSTSRCRASGGRFSALGPTAVPTPGWSVSFSPLLPMPARM